MKKWHIDGTARQIAGYFDGDGIGQATYWHAKKVLNEYGEPVAHVAIYRDDSGDYCAAYANARLIAAAPELLAACKAAVVVIAESKSENESERGEVFRMILAAIEKAEGGAK